MQSLSEPREENQSLSSPHAQSDPLSSPFLSSLFLSFSLLVPKGHFIDVHWRTWETLIESQVGTTRSKPLADSSLDPQ